jgi:phosphatidylinositol alpha-mannosyltransferase
VLIAPGQSEEPGFIGVGPATVVPANGAETPVALSPRVAHRVIDALSDVDVAHVHEPLMPQVSLAALRRAQVPMVGTFHADVSALAAGVYRFGKPLTSKWFERLDVITAVSPIAARVVAETGRVRIIPNGIDVDEYTNGAKVPGSVAFLGRDDERKGLPVLLEAWPIIHTVHPEAQLAVIGAEDQGRSIPGVHFLGRVSEEDKRKHLKQSSIFCAPNLSGESFGIVVVEAMAAGCAVVATGLPAFVHVAGDAARFVGKGDAAGLAAEVIALLGDPATTNRLGTAAAASSRRFGADEVAGAYIAAYEDAVAGRRN